MNHKFSTLALALSLLGTASCNDFLDQYSQDRVVAKTVQDLNELLVGDVYLKSYVVNKGVSAGTYRYVTTGQRGQHGVDAHRSSHVWLLHLATRCAL